MDDRRSSRGTRTFEQSQPSCETRTFKQSKPGSVLDVVAAPAGKIDEEVFVDMARRYLASIPAAPGAVPLPLADVKPLDFSFPERPAVQQVPVHMVEPRAQVQVAFPVEVRFFFLFRAAGAAASVQSNSSSLMCCHICPKENAAVRRSQIRRYARARPRGSAAAAPCREKSSSA